MTDRKKRRVTFLLGCCIFGAFFVAYTSVDSTIGQPGTAVAMFFQVLIVALWGAIMGLEIRSDD